MSEYYRTRVKEISIGPAWYKFFFLHVFLANQRFISQSSPLSPLKKVSPQPSAISGGNPATHRMLGSQLWAAETPHSNPGLQDNSHARYH
jgi:hypothetical protein